VTTEQIIGLALAFLIMSIGMLGTILPGLPSTPFILVPAILHRLYFGEASASYLALGIMIGLALLSLGLDYIATLYGAKKLGATWRGMLGAVLGALIGLFFSLPGILLGPFVGAALLELAGGRRTEDAIRAGVGAVLGIFVGALGKAVCCIVMITLFTYSVVHASLSTPESPALPPSSAVLPVQDLETPVSRNSLQTPAGVETLP